MASVYSYNDSNSDDFSLPLAVIISLIIHLVFFVFLFTTSQPKNLEVPYIDVSFEPASFAKQQIVSTTESQKDLLDIKPVTNQVAEKDVAVAREQIKRGMPDASLQKSSQKQAQPAIEKPAAQAPQKPAPKALTSPSLKDLTLNSTETLNAIQAKNPAPKNLTSPSTARPFSRPVGSGAQFFGSAGNADFLPNLPDGDITLLNAKANQYAVFVRRVAIQVFTQIRSLGWDDLNRGDINRIANDAHIVAKMSPAGQLLSIKLVTSSQSINFDEIIVKASRTGTKDPNPPTGAIGPDGNIGFIFKARSWSDIYSGRGGIPTERRWIMLSTGLE